jgi:hypothetical protein
MDLPCREIPCLGSIPDPQYSQSHHFRRCLSGLGYATAGSDILGFTHVILGNDCQAYLGGLIEINDFASTVLMVMFYRSIKQYPHHSIAEYLRQAQLELMQMDEKKERRLLEELED